MARIIDTVRGAVISGSKLNDGPEKGVVGEVRATKIEGNHDLDSSIPIGSEITVTVYKSADLEPKPSDGEGFTMKGGMWGNRKPAPEIQ